LEVEFNSSGGGASTIGALTPVYPPPPPPWGKNLDSNQQQITLAIYNTNIEEGYRKVLICIRGDCSEGDAWLNKWETF
jgi:hypothetical protein